ncbi:O-antigen ligase family protein [Brevundimonas sp. NIBR11]|uniref:O-antigen ligase family protein n=1 Tax=Brevundimonas sp. NIBR11 TaxID=3015999 RepID=UPI0022EFF873|nr:O-antigen ligase family protein [Brevundimonas sp. NIBR11]WGM31823.1 hypothetical protein KKHFBJBL_02072 [Brevundimonas sp. NIBR11]
MTGARSRGVRPGETEAAQWAMLGLAPAAIYLGHFFLGAALPLPALILLMVLSGLLCIALSTRRARLEVASIRPVWPLVTLFGLVIGSALLSLTDWAPGGGHPIWAWVDAPPAASINVSATLIEIVKLIGLAAVFVLGCLMGATRDRARRSLQLVLWLGAAYALVSLVIFLGGEELGHASRRLTGGFATANVAGAQFGVLSLLALSWGMRQLRQSRHEPTARRVTEVAPSVAALLLFLVCLMMTASRAALGATGLAMAALTTWQAISDRRARWPTIAAGCLVAVLAAVVFARGNTLFVDRFDTLASGGEIRAAVYDAHWRAFLASPLSGYGLGSYSQLNNQIMTSLNAPALSDSVILHNAYLQWLVEGGVFGAAAIVLLIAAILGWTLWRMLQRQRNSTVLAGLLAASGLVLVHAAVDVPLNTPSFEAFWALLLGLGFAMAQTSSIRR